MAKKILLADDSLTIQKVVELTFSDSEYELVCVSNGQRVLDRIEAGEMPDLILADVVMPEKNGYEVCEAIKANPATARIPVVLLSGTFEPFDRDRADRLGCDAIVSKPFDSQQLLRQVEALLARPASQIPTTATMAIPVMTMAAPVPPPPPPPAAPAPPAGEAGFAPEDFTGSIRTPTTVAGGPDLFEEEYGQVDVESAIAAFEKAHPEFEYGEATAPGSVPGDVEPGPESDVAFGARSGRRMAARGTRSCSAARVPGARAVLGAPRSGAGARAHPVRRRRLGRRAARRSGGPARRRSAHAADPARRRVRGARTHDRLRPRTGRPIRPRPAPRKSGQRRSRSSETRSIFAAPPPAPAEPADGVPSEIEVLAQNTSIGQLKEMLSSVSRPEGGLSDDEIDRLASRVVERLSERIVREIAWEVIPDVAEIVIKQRIRELESGVE